MKTFDLSLIVPRLCGFIILLFIPACQRSEPSSVTIEHKAVGRVNGCNVSVDSVNFNPKYPDPFLSLRYVCDVPESALKEKEWWGNKPQPLMFSLGLGDCLRLNKVFYCAKDMKPGKSVTFEATFKESGVDGDVIERIK